MLNSGSILAIGAVINVGIEKLADSSLILLSPVAVNDAQLYIGVLGDVPITFNDGQILGFDDSLYTVSGNQTFNSARFWLNIVPATVGAKEDTFSKPAYLKEVLGIQNLTLNKTSNLIGIRSQKSGLGNEQRPTRNELSVTVEGWGHHDDIGFNLISDKQAYEIYLEIFLPNKGVYAGLFIPSQFQILQQLGDVSKYSVTFTNQGQISQAFL